MISISFANATLVLGARTIFKNITWEIQHDSRIGLIGANGAGKSSLFKMIIGEYEPEQGGAVVRAKGVSVGYLPQDPELDLDATALACALAGNARIAELESELARVESKLADPKVYGDEKILTRVLDEQHKLIEEYESLGGATYHSRVEQTLRGLGLADSDFGKPIRALSGGQKKLVGLARLLLAKPSVLLLDEPDNHLDLPGKAYLEKLIDDYDGAIVLISHDRYLLDAVVTQIAEIEDGGLFVFNGDYTAYIIDKEERLARAEELYQIQQRMITRLELALRRYSTWVIKSDKFASRVRSMKTRLEKVDRLDRPMTDRKRMDLELNGWRGSNKVLELIKVKKGFGVGANGVRAHRVGAHGRAPLQNINLLIRHGERVGLIGANGAGKSVLLKIIIGEYEPDAGEMKIGPSVKMGYYAQEHETLDFDQTLIDAVRRAKAFNEGQAVSFLGRYLFGYRQASQKIGSLSGGERSRLQLALLVLSGVNFLLLDEPTNNLDIASAEVLVNALDEFEGTALIISHDRYFLDRTVNRIVELEGGALTEYGGGYSDYVEKKIPSPPDPLSRK
ncbi:MAG: ABC-F family ATP-binding cassette domain-containing protein [Chloroflexi bacterium]|nr:ABC-F family ATP-binding cassette domain-containing protein [Chloroflexota bacterium]